MSKWKPLSECMYVIPDIHGYYDRLIQIIKRITPLRKKDRIIFLGDYIDRGPRSDKVLDLLIKLNDDYPGQIIYLLGNHDYMLLSAIGEKPSPNADDILKIWLQNGGLTTLKNYCDRKGIDYNNFPIHRLKNIIPSNHIEFINNCKLYYELDDYIFVHAGCDPFLPLEEQYSDLFLWDRTLFTHAINCINNKKEMGWDKTIITGHNYYGPIITPKFMMLDCSKDLRLLSLELNSMEAFYSYSGRTRMLKFEIGETLVAPNISF